MDIEQFVIVNSLLPPSVNTLPSFVVCNCNYYVIVIYSPLPSLSDVNSTLGYT